MKDNIELIKNELKNAPAKTVFKMVLAYGAAQFVMLLLGLATFAILGCILYLIVSNMLG